MLSVETENKLSKLLLTLADGESSVETTRQVLATTYGFDAYSLFRLVDVESKGFIDSVNIVELLRKNSIYASDFEAQQIIYHYDVDLSNTLNYAEFLNLVISDRNVILKHSSSSYKPFEPIPYDVESSFIRLLEKELALVKSVYSAIRDISLRYDFNVTDAFRAVDVLGIDNINSESVRKFLIRNYVTPSEQDIVNIIKRLDTNKDYRIDYIEFKNLFSSYSYGYTSTSTVIQYSPLRRTYYYSPVRTHLYCSPRRCYSPLRSYYSPVKSRTIYSPIRESPKVFSSTGFKSSSPIKTYTSEVLSRSPKRVESPNRKQQILSPRSQSTGFSQSTLENKYVTYEEELFQKYIKELIQVESSLETNKNEVALKSDFNMEDVFTIFEKFNKGFISEYDFKDGLNRYFSLFPLSDEISVLFKRYDNEKNLSLSYGDFFNMLAPVSPEYRRLVENRVYPNSSLIGDPLSSSTKFAVKSLLNNIISSEQVLEDHRRKMKSLLSFNSKAMFEKIGGFASNYFSEKDFMFYLEKNGIIYLQRDVELLFIRLSKNKKGLISFTQFLDEISPRY